MSSAKPSGALAARLIIAACSPRRAQSQVAPISATMFPTGFLEDALTLANAISAARSEGGGRTGDELICFVRSQSPTPPDASSSFQPQPSNRTF
ncbi:hypothetical protein Cni_G25700 [Canna indica]|uniref:Uncharacterized protein n=1 Tax=Canna indica TaxID=4628 RepID=A0AAQ3L0H2_9LILI|nr:hypothetical protein Cni_G25700 [Canna indica]